MLNYLQIIKPIAATALIAVAVLSYGQKPEEKKLTVTQKPDENRFTPVVVAQDLDEPMTFEVLKNGKVYIAERKGGLKVYDPITESTKLITMLPVNTKYTSAEGVVREAEEGLVGMTVDPNFDTNHWMYILYASPTESKFVLSRFDVVNDKLVAGSEKQLLDFKSQRETCCHTGGGMTWDQKGNLFVTIGNNTGNSRSSQTDERPNRSSWDDQRGAANTNDLRGKIIRIHPEANGTYSIPEGNLFPKGTPNTRAEIYVMGNRNPWRPSVDSKTGFLYWGEVGPDASEDTELGPRGYDEFNQARKPGFFGWPYFVGENQAYPYYDYAADKPLAAKDPSKPTNTSVNNTGLKELPPAQVPFVTYPYAPSEKYPEVGTGGRASAGGPIYHRSDFKDPKRPLPAYYEGKWIAADLHRGWIMAFTMNDKGDYVSMEKFVPNYHPVGPMDLKFGPSGDLYVLEYGTNTFRKSDNSQLVRIEYNSGNRTPQVQVSASKNGDVVPAKIKLSSEGTKDFDGDALKYEWKVTPDAGGAPKVYATANPEVTLDKAGVYTATLTAIDPKGAKSSKSLKIIAGNESPEVAMTITGNKTFFFPDKPIEYAVRVSDKEDGSLDNGKIAQDKVAVSIDYTSEGFDYAEVVQGQRSVDASARYAVAQALMAQSDCSKCHAVDTKSIGPAFMQVAEKYKGDDTAVDKLSAKIRAGGSGVWGDVVMAAHPALSMNDANTIVKYILNINDKTISTLPVKGTYTQKIPAGDNGRGSLILRAAYTDAGAKTVPSITSESQIVLKSPFIAAQAVDVVNNAELQNASTAVNAPAVVPRPNGYMGIKAIDLTGVKQLEFGAVASSRTGNAGGTIEVRLDSPTGDLLGQVEVKVSGQQIQGAAVAQNGAAGNNRAGGAAAPPNAAAPGARQGGAGGGNPFAQPGAKADIKEVNGVHDVYLVFKNDSQKPSQPLMTVTNIRFNDEKK